MPSANDRQCTKVQLQERHLAIRFGLTARQAIALANLVYGGADT
jgi:hypothetical protein